jgi:hypothetical protein
MDQASELMEPEVQSSLLSKFKQMSFSWHHNNILHYPILRQEQFDDPDREYTRLILPAVSIFQFPYQ